MQQKMLFLLLSSLLSSWSALAQKMYHPGCYQLTNFQLVDIENRLIRTDVSLLVQDGLIKEISEDPAVREECDLLDLDGTYLLPGMIDVHTHLSSLESAKVALHSGVTTVRSASVPAYQDVALAHMVEAAKLAGPDMVPAGVYVTPDLGETALADSRLAMMDSIDTEEELRAVVRINVDRGARVIKARGTERAGLPDTDPRKQTYTLSQLEVIMDEAAKLGVPVMVHAHGDEGAMAAVQAGAKSIEHGTFLSDETLQLMKERDCFLVPTHITLWDLVEPGGDYDDPVINMRGRYMIPKSEVVIKRAHELGVKLATGADNRYHPHSTSRVSMEVEHFVRLGMAPYDALKTTTSLAAELLDLSSLTGKLEVGLEADLIAVPDNPIESIKALQDVVLVMSNGQLVVNRLPFGR